MPVNLMPVKKPATELAVAGCCQTTVRQASTEAARMPEIDFLSAAEIAVAAVPIEHKANRPAIVTSCDLPSRGFFKWRSVTHGSGGGDLSFVIRHEIAALCIILAELQPLPTLGQFFLFRDDSFRGSIELASNSMLNTTEEKPCSICRPELTH